MTVLYDVYIIGNIKVSKIYQIQVESVTESVTKKEIVSDQRNSVHCTRVNYDYQIFCKTSIKDLRTEGFMIYRTCLLY